MTKLNSHIKTLKNIGVIWFVLSALSPCTVKDVFFSSVKSEYSKPLNKSRTTAPIVSCSSTNIESKNSLVVNQLKFHKEFEPGDRFIPPFFHFQEETNPNVLLANYSGKSPPKYILYKRLKIAIV